MAGWPSLAPAENAEIVARVGAQPAGELGLLAAPPTPKLASTRLRLETVSDVKRELKRVYLEARRGELKLEHAGKLAYLLDLTSRLIERSDLERRLEALEAAKGAR
jgi:hypothetical protein